MKKKLSCIMLVDDDQANNYLNKKVLDKLGCAEHIEIAQNGLEALDLIRGGINMDNCMPKLIFLDMNMPVMDGWEFLEEYHKMNFALKRTVKIVVLTTSLNPYDKAKAEGLTEILAYVNKPLRPYFISELLRTEFNLS